MTNPPSYAWQRVADAVAERIASGDLRQGDRVPSVHELADTYGVSRGTARHALADLKARGLTVALTGLGTFVA